VVERGGVCVQYCTNSNKMNDRNIYNCHQRKVPNLKVGCIHACFVASFIHCASASSAPSSLIAS
jgi:hypothetical protein